MGANGNNVRLAGKRFGRIVVLSRAGNSDGHAVWRCQCDCGRVVDFRSDKLQGGFVRSCGKNGHCSSAITEVASAEFAAWRAMRSRCASDLPAYGGRGIAVCARWQSSFEQFLSDMGPKPSPKHSLDRYPDHNGNYEPGNCRWATKKQQSRNRRVTLWVEDGRITLREYLEQHGVDADKVRAAVLRAHRKGEQV